VGLRIAGFSACLRRTTDQDRPVIAASRLASESSSVV
jgi:hypothetical protein